MAKTNAKQKASTNNKPVYFDIIIWETRDNAQGKKNIPHKVGFATQLDNGNLACKLIDGISLSGKFTIASQQYES